MTAEIGNRDYYLIIDKSGSMSEQDVAGGLTRWQAVAESTAAIANRIVQLDDDGITVYVFSGRFKRYDNVKSDAIVKNIFKENEPFGGTVLAPVLRDAFSDYFKARAEGKAKANGATILVVTDGAPDDRSQVMLEIIEASKACTRERELGVGFFQIGHDMSATNFLKQLDNDLQKYSAKYDIVAAKTMDEIEDIGLTAALVAAITE